MACGIKRLNVIRSPFNIETRLLLTNALLLRHVHYSSVKITSIDQSLIISLNQQLSWTVVSCLNRTTSRERHKAAPNPRLKNSKRTSKCQVFFYSTRKTQKMDRIGALKGGTLSEFSIFLSQNIKKIEGGPFSLAWYCKLMLRGNFFGSVAWAKWFNLTP